MNSPAPTSIFAGRDWKVIINGRRSTNGALYGLTFSGQVDSAPTDCSIFDVMRDLADHVEEHSGEMEIKESIQITLFPRR